MRRVLIGITAGMGLATLAMLYGSLRPAPVERSVSPEFVIPDAPVGFGSALPTWRVVLFVDLESVASRQAFSQVTKAVADGELVAGPAEVRVLHKPRGGCAGAGRESFRCAAARVVECAEWMSQGTGIRVAGTAFDLQWEPERRSTAELVQRVVESLRLDEAAIERCIAEDPAVEARIAEHDAFAAPRGLVTAPGGFLVRVEAPDQLAPFGASVTTEVLRTLSVCLTQGGCS